MPRQGRKASLLAGSGVLLLSFAIWGLVRDIAPISQFFYAYAWWGWILLLDGFCVWRRGSSLLTTRRSLFWLLAGSSITFWMFFELLNLRFRNWYYIGTVELASPSACLAAGAFVIVAFSTVFIGMFEAFDALGAARILTKRRKRRVLSRWLPLGLQMLGLTMAILAIAFPFYLAPLIWGSFTFLLDPWNYRRGNRSLLRDIEAGDERAVWRLFVAGLISGLIWESLNFFAPQKWIYTVRGLEGFKLFEMPLLGFLGFPALAFDAVTAFSLLSYIFCGRVCWEHPNDLACLPISQRPLRLRRFYLTLPLQALFWICVIYGVIRTNVGSVRLQLSHLPLVEEYENELRDLGLRWPRQLVRALRDKKDRTSVRSATGWSEVDMECVLNQAELYLFKGIGRWNGRLLEENGIHSVAQLASYEPEQMYRMLERSANELGRWAPGRDWVRVWVLASRDDGIVLRVRR